jgi:hypothetical protein
MADVVNPPVMVAPFLPKLHQFQLMADVVEVSIPNADIHAVLPVFGF